MMQKEVKKVWGVGITDKGKYKARINQGSMTPEYTRWTNMLQRCYSEGYHKRQRNYEGSSVCEEWLYFQTFAEWCNEQPNWGKPRYAVDKDLTKLGNSVYCPDYCYIIPQDINAILKFPLQEKENLPIGVFYNEWLKRYESRSTSKDRKVITIKVDEDPMVCFKAYQKFKKERIVEVAEKYKNEISDIIYNNLISYEVVPFPKRG